MPSKIFFMSMPPNSRGQSRAILAPNLADLRHPAYRVHIPDR